MEDTDTKVGKGEAPSDVDEKTLRRRKAAEQRSEEIIALVRRQTDYNREMAISKLKEWDRRGWRIDYETLERNGRKVAYAIPGPARRNKRGWVLDPVPIIGADSEDTGLKAVG